MPPLLEVDSLWYCYPGYQEAALQGTSFALSAGQKVVLVGRNGSGKSTLFLHCNGILRPESGQIRVAGQPVGYDRRALQWWRQRVGVVFQSPDDQLFSASVAQDISFGPLNLGLSSAEARQRVAAAADLCGVADLLERPTHALSGGQKTRVALAGVLAMEPLLLLADEVMANLDPWMRRQVFDIFERMVAQGQSVLLATHDLHVARSWADQVIVMDAGRVVAADTPQRVFTDPELLRQTGLHEIMGDVRR
jgi:cobalt/nickel transport system ATP-binding protein